MSSVVIHSERQTYISLYSGGGGLDIGFRRENPTAQCVLYVERDIEASALLADHIEAGLMDAAPIWSDSSTLDCAPFIGKVDWIIAGFPCQPWSFAGKRSTTDDSRWLWPHIDRIVREVRPRGLLLENVPGLVRGGLELVLRDLAESGFDAEWGSLKASEVGASHRRERVFIVAYRNDGLGSTENDKIQTGRESSNESGERVADSYDSGISAPRNGDKREGATGTEEGENGSQPEPRRPIVTVADSVSKRGRGWHTGGEYAEHDFAPGPSASAEWRDILSRRPDLAPATLEYKNGHLANGMARGLARYAQLRILGNGVVPQQAAMAFRLLKERLQ